MIEIEVEMDSDVLTAEAASNAVCITLLYYDSCWNFRDM